MRVAGVATDEAHRELLRFMVDRGYPTVSRALGAALEEWLQARKEGVLHPVEPRTGDEKAPRDAEIVHPTISRQERS